MAALRPARIGAADLEIGRLMAQATNRKGTMTVRLIAMASTMSMALSAPLAAAWLQLPEAQVQQLHQSICAVPVRPGGSDRPAVLVCDVPRDYPDPAREGATARQCPLSFNAAADESVGLFYGRFTADETQAFVFYQADCEPHANNFGGAALFRVENGEFLPVRYYPGMAAEDCVVPAVADGERHTLYCYTSYLGQGELTESFGPLRFRPAGGVDLEPWLTAGNYDAALAVMVECDKPKLDIRFFTGLRLEADSQRIVMEGAVLDLSGVASACGRYRRNDFNADETALRDMSSAANGGGFIRPGEETYLKAVVRFTPPDPTPDIDITTTMIDIGR